MSGVVTIILAAGDGKRIGGPKALLAWPGLVGSARTEPTRGRRDVAGSGPKPGERPLAIAHAEERLGAESAHVLIVTRKPIIAFLLRYVRPGIDLLASDAPAAQGPAGSLAAGATRLPAVMGAAPTHVVVTPVDTPPARAETVAALIAALDGDPALLAARPRHRGRTGHPVVLRPSVLDRYLEPNPPPLRDLLSDLGARCAAVDLDDPAVLADLDTPADVVGALGSLPRFLSS